MITQTYNLNLIPNNVPVVVNASQYDKTSRTLNFNIYNGDVLYTIPSGSTITVRGTKLDKTGFEYECTFNGSVVSFEIQDQMTVISGKYPVEIRIINNGDILGTANFIFNIEPTTLDDDTVISETQLPLLENAEQNAIRAETAAQQAEATIQVMKVLVITTSSISSLPQTITNSNITSDMVVVNSVLSNPSAQTSNITVNTSNGSLTLSGSLSGSTTITLYLLEKR